MDLSRATYKLWMMLGEAESKIEHLRGVPLRPEAQEELQRVYLAKGALASAQIEGNTLSEQEAISLVEGQLQLPPSREYLAQEVQNIVDAVNKLALDLQDSGPVPITPAHISEFNRLVLRNLSLEPGVAPGEYRTSSVAVGPYVGAPAEDVPFLVDKMCDWLATSFELPEDRKEMRTVFPILQAILAHLYFEWIHPFGDGNGRTGRLIEFHLLVSSGVPFPAAHLLSNHYNQTRSEYYRQLHLASASGGNVIPFIEYAVQGFVDGLRSQIEKVQGAQIDVMWENYVHHEVPGATSTAERRRTLVFELTRVGQPAPRRDLMDMTPELRRAYSDKTPKTLSRDLNFLRDLGLLALVPGGWVANKQLVRGFLPQAVASSN
ncbi:MAG: Fic family protein [Actinomycetota bacterium]|nr:Fic family protein [Actinomycetota bacterium]